MKFLMIAHEKSFKKKKYLYIFLFNSKKFLLFNSKSFFCEKEITNQDCYDIVIMIL